MHVDNGKGSLIRLIGGFLILVSVILGFIISDKFFFFTGFIGFMLMLSSLTGFCPMEFILKKLGCKEKKCC
jgi:hypothetical protein